MDVYYPECTKATQLFTFKMLCRYFCIKKISFTLFTIFGGRSTGACHGTRVSRVQPVGIGSLLPPCCSLGLNSGCQTLWKTPLPISYLTYITGSISVFVCLLFFFWLLSWGLAPLELLLRSSHWCWTCSNSPVFASWVLYESTAMPVTFLYFETNAHYVVQISSELVRSQKAQNHYLHCFNFWSAGVSDMGRYLPPGLAGVADTCRYGPAGLAVYAIFYLSPFTWFVYLELASS